MQAAGLQFIKFFIFFLKKPYQFLPLGKWRRRLWEFVQTKKSLSRKKNCIATISISIANAKILFFFPQKCSVSNETLDSSFFFDGRFNRAVVFSIFTLVCLLSFPLWFGLFQIVLFVRLLSWTHIWHISLKSLCIRPIWHRIQETWKKNTYSPALACANFKCHFIFHSGSSKRDFCCKEHSCKSKIVKVSNFPPVFTRFLLFLSSPVFERYDTEAKISNFLPFVCLFVKLDTYLAYLSPISLYSNDMTPNARNLKKKHLFSCLYLRKFWICHSGFSKRSFWCKQHSCSCLFSQLSTKLLKFPKLSWSFF